jgi:alkylhydroperoxidase/carboxymuconolactone decarboxylase family protein YurZ
MDDKTSVLVCLGAAIAANCVPCFRHHYGEAVRIGLEPSEIDAAVMLGAKVKTGANIAIMSAVAQTTRRGEPRDAACGDNAAAPSSCCARQD